MLADLTIGLLARLPLSWLQTIGALIGRFGWLTRHRYCRVTRQNIELCFPTLGVAERRVLVRRHLTEAGKLISEAPFAWAADPDRCRRSIVAVEGMDRITASSGPLILVLPHLGNWELLNHFLGERFGLIHMYRPLSHPSLNNLLLGYRARTGTRFVTSGQSGLRAQLRVLQDGGTIGVMPDQEPGVHDGIFADFFDIKALTSTHVSRLAERTGARVVVCWCKRLARRQGFKVIFEPVPDPQDIASMNSAIEHAVRSVPEQYLWGYKRFRTRPAGEAELYPPPPAPIRQMLLKSWLRLTPHLPLAWLGNLGTIAGRVAVQWNSSPARVADINIRMCEIAKAPAALVKQSVIEHFRRYVEMGYIWQAPLDSLIVDADAPDTLGSTLVLTPALGQPELVIRYLAAEGNLDEYFYPPDSTTVNQLVRRQRLACGIRLRPWTEQGETALVRHLRAGGIASMRPDQQPRLRGGEFVEFFGVPALTTSMIGRIAGQESIRLAIGTALPDRNHSGFRLKITPVQVGEDVLRQVNAELEKLIEQTPEQYHWTARRFNIRPRGERKVY